MKEHLRKILDEIQDLDNKLRKLGLDGGKLLEIVSYLNAARRALLNAGKLLPEEE